ncbi:MAG: hypothetical protein IPK46_21930 [Saprospiraceae bacterium]|nr:hypothetical protein [Saprospiraceae bacterium]
MLVVINLIEQFELKAQILREAGRIQREFPVYRKGKDAFVFAFEHSSVISDSPSILKHCCNHIHDCLDRFTICINHIKNVQLSDHGLGYVTQYMLQIFTDYIGQIHETVRKQVEEEKSKS